MPTGANSCYFEESASVLKSLHDTDGSYESICKNLATDFGPESDYDQQKKQDFSKNKVPIQGKWVHGAVVHFLNSYSNGSSNPFGDPSNKETDGFCASLPICLKYAGKSEFDDKVMEMITTMTTFKTSVYHCFAAAKIVEKFVLNSPDPISEFQKECKSEEVKNSLNMVEKNLSKNHIEAVGTIFGKPCYNPGSFQGAIHSIMSSNSFEEAVRKTIKAGGCNCSRSVLIGACAGAKFGFEGIPEDWIEKSHNAESIVKNALDVF